LINWFFFFGKNGFMGKFENGKFGSQLCNLKAYKEPGNSGEGKK
jgi:hypothetical protein